MSTPSVIYNMICPHCGTSQPASYEQLAQSRGQMVCKHCLRIFAAKDNLMQPQPAHHPAPAPSNTTPAAKAHIPTRDDSEVVVSFKPSQLHHAEGMMARLLQHDTRQPENQAAFSRDILLAKKNKAVKLTSSTQADAVLSQLAHTVPDEITTAAPVTNSGTVSGSLSAMAAPSTATVDDAPITAHQPTWWRRLFGRKHHSVADEPTQQAPDTDDTDYAVDSDIIQQQADWQQRMHQSATTAKSHPPRPVHPEHTPAVQPPKPAPAINNHATAVPDWVFTLEETESAGKDPSRQSDAHHPMVVAEDRHKTEINWTMASIVALLFLILQLFYIVLQK